MPSPKDIQETVEKQESFLRWLVETWQSKNWVRALLLLEVILLIFLNPVSLSLPLQYYNLKLLSWYAPVWGGIIGAVFIVALVIALRTRPRVQQTSLSERRAIKGLRPFTFSDAEIFTRLERGENLRECLVAISDRDFRFGILCGESGCGKTSFLQAGLWPNLLKHNHRCVYVKFSDLDPLDSIRQAFVESLRVPIEITKNATFLSLLESSVQDDSSPIILLFDQFEQFFIHRKSKYQRQNFIQDLTKWYQRKPPLSIKILTCLRGDFSDRLIELQKALGYSLGPQEVFRIEKFEPKQATAVFRIIAEIEGIAFDERFVEEMATQELASHDDGLVSPVDVQILAWMIAGQMTADERAFNRRVYQKLGGVEGLLERFLKRALDAREFGARRQTTMKVLLVLTDLEQNTRAGTLTLDEVYEKTAGTISPKEIEEAIEWLSRSDVRLITPVERDGTRAYELAHERLIPALRRIAGQELSETDQANQLLERRVNEWMGNNRTSRYLFTWRELLLIRRHKPFIVWGTKRIQKEALLSRSRRRLRLRIATFSLALLALISFLVVLREQPTTRDFRRVPLTFLVSNELEITNDPRRDVFIMVQGGARDLDGIRTQALVAVVDISNYSPGDRVVRLSPENTKVNLPSGVYIVNIEPETVPVQLERSVERDIEVEVRLEGSPAKGYELRSVKVSPNRVRVRGPASHVNALSKALTEVIPIVERKEGFTVPQLVVDIPDQKITLMDPVVAVRIEIGPK